MIDLDTTNVVVFCDTYGVHYVRRLAPLFMTNQDEQFREMMDLHADPLVQDFYHHLEAIAGFSLPPSLKSLFDTYHRHCFDQPRPQFTADWGKDSPNWRWQKLHSGSLGSCQSALTAVLYHRENLLRLERDVLSFLDIDRLIPIMGRATTAGGNTQKINFEYHAFVFAYRRALDYLAIGMASLLRQEFHSFRRLPTLLNKHSEHVWVVQLLGVHSRYVPRLKTFLGSDKERSARDKIAHYLSVEAACVNVNAKGLFLAGGPEALDHSTQLGVVIDEYVRILRDVISESLSAMASGLPKNAAKSLDRSAGSVFLNLIDRCED